MIQDILIETIANSTDSIVRDQFNKLINSDAFPLQLLRTSMSAPKMIVDNFIPSPFKLLLLPATLPFTLPYDVVKMMNNYIELDDKDNQVIDTFNDVWKIVTPKVADQLKTLADTNKNDNNNINNNVHNNNIPRNIQDLLSILNTDLIIQVLNDKRTQSRFLSIMTITKKITKAVLTRMELRTNEKFVLNSNRLNLQSNNGRSSNNDDNSNMLIQSILNKLVETTIKSFIRTSNTILDR
jgi:hypothetical protein